MALETYRNQRNFSSTPEPEGGRPWKTGDSFVIQKHDATRLHYDFRLEMDGVLKSWAVPKGPSLIAGEKRLAVHVEDHPLEYGDFEGAIPKGEYGGGAVIVWDRGRWEPIGDAHKGYAKGHLDFELRGAKLGGRWHLVRMHGKPREKRENWLLIKGDDEFARPQGATDILDERPRSAKTGRALSDIAGEAPGWSSKTGRIRAKSVKGTRRGLSARPTDHRRVPIVDAAKLKGAKKTPLPDFVAPALASLVASPPSGERWIHEIKLDGYRLEARMEAGRVQLLTRSGLDWTKKFGKEVVAALQELPISTALIDGELVVETSAGASDFSALQADLSQGRSDRFVFYVFDLLYLDGVDLRSLPLIRRKELLELLVAGADGPIRYSGHFDENGDLVLRHVCRLSLEGVVSKLRDAPYRSGRSKSWVKSKCSARQEFVVAGYAPSTTSRKAIGSLVLGVYEDGVLRPVGRVGTGFTGVVAESLFKRLERMRVTSSPFGVRLSAEDSRQARFVRPELVAEVEFRAWNGVTGEKFFQKHAWKGLSPKIVLVRDPKEPSEAPLISINHLDGLMGLVQSAALEIHPWGSTVADWERPDVIVMDLDPGDDVPWLEVIAAAGEVRQRLRDAGLAAFVKTSGGKGLHIVSPLKPKAEWPAVKAFAKGVADAMAADSPDRFVATITKSKRRGRILVDYLRNQRGATAVAAYSTRARPGAAVSMPLAWEELGSGIGPAYFTVENAPIRLASLAADPWDGFRAAATPIEMPRRRSRRSAT